SILFFAAGTGAPLVATTVLKAMGPSPSAGLQQSWVGFLARVPITEIGYLLLAMADALVLLDQFFQYSMSWMRYRQAQAHREVLLADLRFSWNRVMASCGGVITDGKAAAECVDLLRRFVVD